MANPSLCFPGKHSAHSQAFRRCSESMRPILVYAFVRTVGPWLGFGRPAAVSAALSLSWKGSDIRQSAWPVVHR